MATTLPEDQPSAPVQTGATHAEAGSALEFDSPMEVEDGEETQDDALIAQNLASYVQAQWQIFKNHETTIAFEEQCNKALRVYKGEYSSAKMAEIQQFGGSTVYSHITSTKCRGATALLRDIFLGQEQAWGLAATPNPKLPNDIGESITQMVDAEVQQAAAAGVQVEQVQIDDRVSDLKEEARKATEVKAREESTKSEKYLQDMLVEGGYYDAMVDFITDLPIYPVAIIKGPVVRNVTENRWTEGKLEKVTVPKMFWYRVSPFDLYFTPGASKIEDASTVEFSKMSRADLNAVIGLDGYDEEAIRAVLTEYSAGYVEARADDSERAYREGREDPWFNQSGLIDTLEWQGPVQGKLLLDYGYTPEQIPDEDLDYFVQAWVIGRHTIKVQIKPNAKQRPNYYITSFEKVPGSIRGLALPDILDDIQDMANGTLRALGNNLAMSSGPQVAIDEEQISPGTDANSMYPWKRWRFRSDPMATNTQPAISFFQPPSNATELLGVYQAMTNIADETSSIPRYLTGNEKVGGAGRTASGLSMLMSSASKMIQVVAANVDRDVQRPSLQELYDLVMLVDQGENLRGDEDIQVRGVEIARQKEMERSRRMEFLQITQNPVDQQLMGMRGRANVIRPVADDLGLPGALIVPSDKDLEMMEAQQQANPQPGGGVPGEAPKEEDRAADMANEMRGT